MATDFSKGIFDDKTKRLGFDEREVSLQDIVHIAQRRFLGVHVDRIIVQDHNNWHRPDNFHVFLSVRKPTGAFLTYQSGERSCKPPGYQTLGQLIEEAENVPNCDLAKVRLMTSADNDRVSLRFAADCKKKPEPWVTTRQESSREREGRDEPVFQPHKPANIDPPAGGYPD